MVKKVLALCDKEEDYLRHMLDYLEKKSRQPFTVRAFTDVDRLKKFVEKNETEILMVSESSYREELEEWPVKHLLVLNESGNRVGRNAENISKYQSSEGIYQAVIGSYVEKEGEIPQRIVTGRQMKIIGNYSPVGRCLQTTFALSMGQILAKKHKTLYLNFEAYSGFGYLLNREFPMDITDVLYYFRCEKDRLSYRLEGMIQTLNGLDYIPPVFSYHDLEEVGGKDWIDLVKEIEKISEYEYLILDLSDGMKGLFDVLRECFRIFTIVKEGNIAEAKLRQYEAVIQSMDYGDIAVKTKRWMLPEFHRIPYGLEQLTHGEMAAYIKKIIEEEIYGHES